MRVISGRAKGRKLAGPRSKSIRPALDKVKEAVFNILFDVSGLDVLDIFAGTGSVGIEALSRGCRRATFIDNSISAVGLIRKNLLLCGFKNLATVIKSSASQAIKRLSKKGLVFDLIFVDPPYLQNLVNPTLELLSKSKLLKPGSIIIVEHHPKEPILPPDGLVVFDSRKYGQTLVSFLKRAPGGIA
jgi:16S rRNA (guanine966-N2)-methyltransferase